jgi:hypothetical protein
MKPQHTYTMAQHAPQTGKHIATPSPLQSSPRQHDTKPSMLEAQTRAPNWTSVAVGKLRPMKIDKLCWGASK